MIILKKYNIIKSNNCYYVISKEQVSCPNCKNVLKIRDTKKRKIISHDEKTYTFNLRRLRCDNCKKIHIELPDIMIPHKHYSTDSIKSALYEKNTSCKAENSTINRWKKEYLNIKNKQNI